MANIDEVQMTHFQSVQSHSLLQPHINAEENSENQSSSSTSG